MKKSLLQQARALYQPKLPKGLQGAIKVKEGEPTQSVGDQEEIKKLFPNTYGMPLIEFVPGTEEAKNEINVAGGAGKVQDFIDLFEQTGVTGALAASIFHFGEIKIPDLKNELRARGITVR